MSDAWISGGLLATNREHIFPIAYIRLFHTQPLKAQGLISLISSRLRNREPQRRFSSHDTAGDGRAVGFFSHASSLFVSMQNSGNMKLDHNINEVDIILYLGRE